MRTRHLLFAFLLLCSPAFTHADDAVDMTDSIVNPNFDTNTNGWTLETTTVQSKISTSAKSDGLIPGGQGHWQLWVGSGGLTGKAYQTVCGLPNGRYEVGCTLSTAFSGQVYLYANSSMTEVVSGQQQRYSVSGLVFDGTLELGLKLQCTSGSATIDMDSFTLTYYGDDPVAYAAALNSKMAEAQQLIDAGNEYVSSESLQQAVAASATTDTTDVAAVAAAIDAIQTAIDDYQGRYSEYEARVETYNKFLFDIADAETCLAHNDLDGKEALQAAIDAAHLLTLTDDVETAGRTLRQTMSDYYNAQYEGIETQPQTVSCVDLSLEGSEKYTLRVDGRPYYMTAVQMRWDKLYGQRAWNDEEMERCAQQAAADGFNTLSVPVFWSEVEPEKDRFDWQILDKYMGWCLKYGMHMELLWFSWSSGGRVQTLWSCNGRTTARTPDYVCSLSCTSEFNMLHKTWEPSLDWRDTSLRDRDAYVLGRVMQHIAQWEAKNGQPHVVVGVQLGNEARAYNENTATAAEIISYYDVVGAAVKNSDYKVWTRLNCVSNETNGRTTANETLRSTQQGTNIDFVGIDVYGTSAASVKGNLSNQLGENGKNYRMIMECDAKDASSPIYQMAALAGDKAFDYYNYAVVDGNCLYSADDNHTLVASDHVTLVRQRNTILNLANQDIAILKQGGGLYVYNYAGNSTSKETGLNGITFTPFVATTQAVALQHSEREILLMATAIGTFNLPKSFNVKSVTYGHLDASNNWVEESEVQMTATRNYRLTKPSCLRVLLCDEEETDVRPVTSAQCPSAVFSTEGISHDSLQHGVNIVQYADGKAKKILRW